MAALKAVWAPAEIASATRCGSMTLRMASPTLGPTPDTAVSLWVSISDPAEEWPEWSQPLGAHDAYEQGAKVSHNGKHWISDVAANVWEPGVYGWTAAADDAAEV